MKTKWTKYEDGWYVGPMGYEIYGPGHTLEKGWQVWTPDRPETMLRPELVGTFKTLKEAKESVKVESETHSVQVPIAGRIIIQVEVPKGASKEDVIDEAWKMYDKGISNLHSKVEWEASEVFCSENTCQLLYNSVKILG